MRCVADSCFMRCVVVLYSFVPPPASSVDSEPDKDLSDLLDFSAVSDWYSVALLST